MEWRKPCCEPAKWQPSDHWTRRHQSGDRRTGFGAALLFLTVMLCGATNAIGQDHPDFGRQLSAAEIIPTLELISKTSRANYESIGTWTGRCEFCDAQHVAKEMPIGEMASIVIPAKLVATLQSMVSEKSGYWLIRNYTASFALDNKSDQYHVLTVSSSKDAFWDLASNVQFERGMNKGSDHFVLIADKAIRFNTSRQFQTIPDYPASASVPKGRVVFVRPFAESSRSHSEVDVRDLFTTGRYVPGKRIHWRWESLSKSAEALRAPAPNKLRENLEKHFRLYVTESASPVYTTVLGKLDQNHVIIRFDGAVAFNVVNYSSANGSEVTRREVLTYEKNGELFLPKTFESQQLSISAEGTESYSYRSMKLELGSLNAPIAESEFDISGFHLKYGDRIVDELKKTVSVVDAEGGIVPAEAFVFDPAKQK